MNVDKYFIKAELIPAIVQETGTNEVLMLAYMNKESMKKTLETGYTWFYSRSRQELWNKGATRVNAGVLAIMNNALIPAGLLVNLLIWNHSADLLRLALGGALIFLSLFINEHKGQTV